MMRMRILLPLVILTAVACRNNADELPAAGALPANAYFIGPQPGPDRVLGQVANPYADDKTVLADGRRLFNWYNCSGCHGDHAGGGMGPSLRDSSWYYGGDDVSIFASITEGRQHGMTSWGSKLPANDIWKIVTYIKSLRTPYEPDPPR
jgi:cytochrome c oxidase cbb3-type subunit 3